MADQQRTAVSSPTDNVDGQPAVAVLMEQVTVDIQVLLNMSEDAVWMLQKKLLRQHFLALQKHFRSLSSASLTTSPITTLAVSSQPAPQPPTTSRLLSLPPEIRHLILLNLLTPPSSQPTRGPHPRSLQSPLSLSRTLPPSLLLTCRQLHTEGSAVLYGAQPVHATIDFDVWTHRRDRSALTVTPVLRCAVRHLHAHVFLGAEKRLARRPGRKESEARLEVVRKGVRKLGKWLVGPPPDNTKREGESEEVGGLRTLTVSWQEPPQTYTWEQKKSVLDEFRALRAWRVEAGEINWGLKYPGRKFRFVEEYLAELGQARGEDGGGEGGGRGGPSSGGGVESYDEMDTGGG
ncbi:hypothetical protein CONLIGDRAFT_683365 [Coniochaeta ligniaria NRRL 30616]|uniref:F-box domain-containing protein n=1 Tax=Coniochaeta ligniaria NRRL 30616 TaxID=1408157 RepID=A0A1J7JFK1_9PEZI|nr:hypothetical protein CONLIGDRAFT_683365 [Coniochaeta ligniaria NRRL 30616]